MKINKGRKLSREKKQRKALIKSLAREFFIRGRIKTTEAKAKESLPFIENIITKAKKENLHSRRILLESFDKILTKKIIEEIAPNYKERSGGYVKIIKLGQRNSDGAKMVFLELIQSK